MVYRSCNSWLYYEIFNKGQFLHSNFYFFYFLIFFSVIRGYSFLKNKKLSFYDSFLLSADAFAFVMYIILGLKWMYYYWISNIFLFVFLLYYFTKCSKHIKYFICIAMIFSIIKNIIPSYDYYKYEYRNRVLNKEFFHLYKNNDFITFNSFDKKDYVVESYYKYVFNETKNIINLSEYNTEEIINKIIDLPVKEYIVSLSYLDFNTDLFEDSRIKKIYNLHYIDIEPKINYKTDIFLLTPYLY